MLIELDDFIACSTDNIDVIFKLENIMNIPDRDGTAVYLKRRVAVHPEGIGLNPPEKPA
ncbi:Unknown protein sequence [Pseudomonas amygdali pv. lachrymans]|nr:Unknown protein sequence [Pseudomonas amygdali pv. lachrymans]